MRLIQDYLPLNRQATGGTSTHHDLASLLNKNRRVVKDGGCGIRKFSGKNRQPRNGKRLWNRHNKSTKRTIIGGPALVVNVRAFLIVAGFANRVLGRIMVMGKHNVHGFQRPKGREKQH